MRRLAALVCLLTPGAAGLARADSAAGSAGLALPASVRQAGIGEASVAASDLLATGSNPAALTEQPTTWAIAATGGKLFGSEDSVGLAAGWRASPAFTSGLLVSRMGVSVPRVDATGAETGTMSDQTLAIGLALGYQTGWLRAGIAPHMESEDSDAADTGHVAVAADLGVLAEFDTLRLGASLRNLGPKLVSDAVQTMQFASGTQSGTPISAGENQPTEFRLGAAYSPGGWHTTFAAEAAMPADRQVEVGGGAEAWLSPGFALRAGYVAASQAGRFTAGLSVMLGRFGIDYGFGTHAALGITNRVTLSYAFNGGWSGQPAAAAAEQPVEAPPPAPVARPAGSKPLNFAVADLRGENVSAGDAAVIGDLFRSELVRTGAFNVVEKQNMDKVLAEQGFQQTGCTTEECAVKLGKLLNVQRMAVGSFGKLLDSYFLNVRVVNIETGQVAYADSVEGRTVGELKTGVHLLAGRLAKGVQ